MHFLFLRFLLDLVVTMICVVQEMTDIGDVLHMRHFVAVTCLEPPPQKIRHEE